MIEMRWLKVDVDSQLDEPYTWVHGVPCVLQFRERTLEEDPLARHQGAIATSWETVEMEKSL